MNKKQFLEKYNLDDLDYRNLVRYEEVRQSGEYNMFLFLYFMERNNSNGGKVMADFIRKHYDDFLSTLKKER